MGASPSQFPQADKKEILAAGLSTALDCKIITESEYERRRHEANFNTQSVENLEMTVFEKLCFEPAKGQFGDVFGESGNKITVHLKSLSGRNFELSVGEEAYVEELKFLFEEQQGIPVDHKRLIFTFKGKILEDGFRLSDYKIGSGSELTLMTDLKASADRMFVLRPEFLMPTFDYDFTDKHDDGTVYERGGHRYKRPYGWYRHALNVSKKFKDDEWLGKCGNRTESSPGEWPVSYHGTNRKNVEGISTQGYRLSKGKRNVYGRGIYSSPSIEVAALYAVEFLHESKKYKLVFQNRVKSDGLKIIPAEDVNDRKVRDDYWLQPCEDYIRPYGICIKAC